LERDYKSFSSAAKSRFRKMAKELGYEQITGILYVKERDGWYESFNLQSSSYGNPFFYINYGLIQAFPFPASREQLKSSGMTAWERLKYKEESAFPCGTKKELEESAEYALEVYKKEALPWFESISPDDLFGVAGMSSAI